MDKICTRCGVIAPAHREGCHNKIKDDLMRKNDELKDVCCKFYKLKPGEFCPACGYREAVMNKTYFSNASWSKIKNTQDDHCLHNTPEKNAEYAESICRQLLDKWGRYGKPCEVRGTCLKTWVTDDKGKIIKEFKDE